jgi:hypothetical protein
MVGADSKPHLSNPVVKPNCPTDEVFTNLEVWVIGRKLCKDNRANGGGLQDSLRNALHVGKCGVPGSADGKAHDRIICPATHRAVTCPHVQLEHSKPMPCLFVAGKSHTGIEYYFLNFFLLLYLLLILLLLSLYKQDKPTCM